MNSPTRSSCPLCGDLGLRAVFRKDAWTYVRCAGCGLVSLAPPPGPAELEDGYAGYLSGDPREVRAWAFMTAPVVKRARDLLEAAAGGCTGRLLDVGCGYGFFLREMKARGWSVEGIELCGTGAEHAARAGIPVFRRPLDSLSLPAGSYDAVTLFYVIEHVPDPVATLEEVHRILRPGGLVLLRWPHTTPVVRLLGPLARRFDLYHTPFHLWDFSPATLTRLLERSRFRGVQTVVGGYTRPASRFGRGVSLVSGALGELLFRASRGRVLLPGLSKTTLARKP